MHSHMLRKYLDRNRLPLTYVGISSGGSLLVDSSKGRYLRSQL